MKDIPNTISSSTAPRPIVFTAQSKKYYYCRDAICEYVFAHGAVPINPFRVFGYFLDDRVERNRVREANNNLIRISDELWVFGATIADGVLFEIAYARSLAKRIRLFSVATRAREIREISPMALHFEPETRRLGDRKALLGFVTGDDVGRAVEPLRLFDSSWEEDQPMEERA